MTFDGRDNALDDIGVLRGDIQSLGGILAEMEEQWRIVQLRQLRSIGGTGDEMRFPRTETSRVELPSAIKVKMPRLRIPRPKSSGAMSIPSIGRSVGTSAPASFAQVAKRSIDVATSCWTEPAAFFPATMRFRARASAFQCRSLAVAQQSCRTAGLFHDQPRSVVAGENNQRLFV